MTPDAQTSRVNRLAASREPVTMASVCSLPFYSQLRVKKRNQQQQNPWNRLLKFAQQMELCICGFMIPPLCIKRTL
jgi:hypothetical protein